MIAEQKDTLAELRKLEEAAKRFREGGGPVAMTELFAALAALEGDEGRSGL